MNMGVFEIAVLILKVLAALMLLLISFGVITTLGIWIFAAIKGWWPILDFIEAAEARKQVEDEQHWVIGKLADRQFQKTQQEAQEAARLRSLNAYRNEIKRDTPEEAYALVTEKLIARERKIYLDRVKRDAEEYSK